MLSAALPVLLQQLAAAPPPAPSTPHHAAPVAVVTAARADVAPVLDGRLDDRAWALAASLTDLVASERTVVRLLFTADAFYVGARLSDGDPQGVVARLARHDGSTHSDEFRVLLDSYHDHRTAFAFIVNPAGVKKDVWLGGDGAFSDASWDPVWEAATAVDSLGWTVELKIPLSQLRFSRAPAQAWGVGWARWIERKHELASFPPMTPPAGGVASRLAHLEGIPDVAAPRRLDLRPFAVTRATYPASRAPGYAGRAGTGLTYGVSSHVMLDAVLYPDFGEVQVDPAFVNLEAFANYLPERRPFFLEDANLFRLGGSGGGITRFEDRPIYVYTRRIGRAPGDIVAAGRLVAKRVNGWNVGVLDAVSDSLGNQFVGRAQRTLGGSGDNTTVGALGTAAHRDGAGAYVGGVDLFHRWGRGAYTLAATLGGSYVRGDTLAMQQAQRSSSRYFQRPDAQGFRYDPGRTSLAGIAGDVHLNRVAGLWNWSVAGEFVSPGFEPNDLGFLNRADRVSGVAKVMRRFPRAGPLLQKALTSLSVWRTWNYDGDPLVRTVAGYVYGQFHNDWAVGLSAAYEGRALDDRLTRGGPLAAKPAGWRASAEFLTNGDEVSGYFLAKYARNGPAGWRLAVLPKVTLRPGPAFSVAVGPRYTAGRDAAQFLFRVDSARYVFADLRQRSLDVDVHGHAILSPSLSLELFAQPLGFRGDHRAFKELRARRTFSFNQYGRDNASTITRVDTLYQVDPDGPGPAAPFTFVDPDFRVRPLLVNLVLRWEYRPGSTLHVAWTQSRSGTVDDDEGFAAGRAISQRLGSRPTNVLVVKLSYWLSP